MKTKVILFMILSLVLVSCWNKSDETKKQKINDDEVVQNLEHINNSMDKAINWWSEEEVMWELWKLKKVGNNTDFNKLPDWLYNLGFKKPDWLIVDKNNSEIWPKSVSITYFTNNIDEAVLEAEKLAKSMNIEESEISPRKQLSSMLKMITDKAQQEEMKKNIQWAMFTNCSWDDCSKNDYSIMLSAFKNEKWVWIFQVVVIKNTKQ